MKKVIVITVLVVQALYGYGQGLQLLQEDSVARIYPDPNPGIFTLIVPAAILIGWDNKTYFEVYNITGEKVYSTILNPVVGRCSVTNISLMSARYVPATYIYRVFNDAGLLFFSGRFVVD
jgi:hypothetical protein